MCRIGSDEIGPRRSLTKKTPHDGYGGRYIATLRQI